MQLFNTQSRFVIAFLLRSNHLLIFDIVQMCGGISLAIQCLRLHASIAGYIGLIPDQGTKIPRATWSGQKQKSVEKG